MNRIKGLFGLGAAVAAALTLGACSQDETAGGDGTLSPMELTATGLQPMVTPMTRATVDGDWSNVTKVAVEVGSEVKEYTVTPSADKKKATLTSTDPFYWPASGGVTVSAWPYDGANMTKPDVVVKSDQSGDGYAASDFIEAVAQSVTKDNNALVFEHRTAKICVVLKAADGSNLTGAVVSIAVGGQTVEKCFNSASDGEYLALIAPTAAAEELTVKIAAGGKNYVYKHTTAVEYEANSQYTFNLKLKGDEVALSGCTITGWNETTLVEDGTAVEDPGFTVDAGTYHVTSAKGLEVWAKYVENSGDDRIKCVLEDDIVMPAVDDGESNWTPISSFGGTFDGNGKTITGLVVNKGEESDAGFIVYNDGKVMNLTLKDAKITAAGGVIGAVASVNNGTIENCHVTGASVIEAVSGNIVGGVAGMNKSTISACHVANCIVSGSSQVGGIAGCNDGQITGCYALCSLKGVNEIGGICGRNNLGLNACYSKCEFEAEQPIGIGGIAGNAALSTAGYLACYWKETTNCNKGVGNGTDPDKVMKITGWDSKEDSNLKDAMGKMNEQTGGLYKYVINPTADNDAFLNEPLVLQAVTNK